jgi:HSP20 family protein
MPKMDGYELIRTLGAVESRSERAGAGTEFPQWALLAAEAWETAHAVVVRLELPGLKREDIDVSIDRGTLRVRGEKRFAGRTQGRTYHLMERAFGRFERREFRSMRSQIDKIDAGRTHLIIVVGSWRSEHLRHLRPERLQSWHEAC